MSSKLEPLFPWHAAAGQPRPSRCWKRANQSRELYPKLAYVGQFKKFIDFIGCIFTLQWAEYGAWADLKRLFNNSSELIKSIDRDAVHEARCPQSERTEMYLGFLYKVRTELMGAMGGGSFSIFKWVLSNLSCRFARSDWQSHVAVDACRPKFVWGPSVH